MTRRSIALACAATLSACLGAPSAAAQVQIGPPADPRLREIVYDPRAVVTVPVRRGVVTHVVLGADEAITEAGSGLGADCAKADAVWCIAAQPGGRHLFVKPKSGAAAPNNLAVVTDRRTHAFRFVVLADADPRPALLRLTVTAPPPVAARAAAAQIRLQPPIDADFLAAGVGVPDGPADASAGVQALDDVPRVRNASYSIAEGEGADDIVPALVFDDGRFTYLRFPDNREVPAVFHVLPDGSETVVNARMDGDLLVVDRVARRLVLRAGDAVVGIWNDAFDIDGAPPAHGTTVPGVRRVLRSDATTPVRRAQGPSAGGAP